MTQNERLDYLVEEFKTDSVRYKDLTTPSDTTIGASHCEQLFTVTGTYDCTKDYSMIICICNR